MNRQALVLLILSTAIGCSNKKDDAPASPATTAATTKEEVLIPKKAATPVVQEIAATPTPVQTAVATPTPTPTPAPIVQQQPAAIEQSKEPVTHIQTARKKSSQVQKAKSPDQSEDLLNEKQKAAEVRSGLDRDAAEAETKAGDTRTAEEKQQWQKLVDYVAEHGEGDESNMGFYVSLKDYTSPNRLEARVANFLSVVGGPGDNGQFAFTRVESSWENWTVTKDGMIEGDQWLFLLSRSGNIARQWHYYFLKDKMDHVLRHESQDIKAGEGEKKWSEMRTYWLKKSQIQK